jgi:hypothetical protein
MAFEIYWIEVVGGLIRYLHRPCCLKSHALRELYKHARPDKEGVARKKPVLIAGDVADLSA